MPWPVYSERFIQMYNVAGATRYTVAGGKRGILTEICLTNPYATTRDVQISVAGLLYFERKFLATERTSTIACRVVIYATEVLEVYVDGTGTGATLSGYLLDDASGRTGPDGDALASAPGAGSLPSSPSWP